MHVVTELQVLAEVKRLSHGDVTISLEHHHGDRVTRLNVTDDEFGKDVKTELNVGESLDDTNGDSPECSNDKSENDRVPSHAGVVGQSRSKGETDHDEKESKVPPVRGEFVLAHELHVDVVELTFTGLPPTPDFTTMEEVSVGDESCNGCKTDTIGQGEGCGQE